MSNCFATPVRFVAFCVRFIPALAALPASKEIKMTLETTVLHPQLSGDVRSRARALPSPSPLTDSLQSFAIIIIRLLCMLNTLSCCRKKVGTLCVLWWPGDGQTVINQHSRPFCRNLLTDHVLERVHEFWNVLSINYSLFYYQKLSTRV